MNLITANSQECSLTQNSKDIKFPFESTRRTHMYVHFNPLTPVLPVTACDEPWPFFLFWCHDFWPKLASLTLSFCRRKRSFQWCPDQSDRPNGALDMHKNAQKVEWKIQSKISCHYTWMLHAKLKLPVSMTLTQKFFNCTQAQYKVNHCSKNKGGKGKAKKKSKNRKA